MMVKELGRIKSSDLHVNDYGGVLCCQFHTIVISLIHQENTSSI